MRTVALFRQQMVGQGSLYRSEATIERRMPGDNLIAQRSRVGPSETAGDFTSPRMGTYYNLIRGDLAGRLAAT